MTLGINLSKYRDTYRIVTHIPRYALYCEGTASLHPYSLSSTELQLY